MTRVGWRSAISVAGTVLVLLGTTVLLPPGDDRTGLASPELTSSGRPRVTFLDSAPDPHIIRTDDRYYAYTTNGSPFGGGDVYNIQRYE
jgi:hypothetical protein